MPKVTEEEKADNVMQTVLEVFKKWDITGDGNISRYELHAALTQLGMSTAAVDKCFDAADVSGDGFLQYQEFLNWLMKSPRVIAAYSLVKAKQGLGPVFTQEICDEHADMDDPSEDVQKVFMAVLVCINEEPKPGPSWTACKAMCHNHRTFSDKVLKFDLSSVNNRMLDKLKPYTSSETFKVEALLPESKLAAALCAWVLAVAAVGIKK
mmetsp:Transcript_28238/g.50962  ORF Transcript_28238/g.50962 Transcript_28238/m.50962 type:complete len:209 (+) Transcript_28238:50-676(+)